MRKGITYFKGAPLNVRKMKKDESSKKEKKDVKW